MTEESAEILRRIRQSLTDLVSLELSREEKEAATLFGTAVAEGRAQLDFKIKLAPFELSCHMTGANGTEEWFACGDPDTLVFAERDAAKAN